MSEPVVTDAPGRSRYEAELDGEVVGFAAYRRTPDALVLPHTVVDPGHGGRGIASALVRAALDDARSAGLSVVPICSFVQDYVGRHPEYADLVGGSPPQAANG